MRLSIAALSVLAFCLANGAQAQPLPNVVTPDNNDGAIAVPSAPAIVAEPPGIQAAPLPAEPAPPGLVPVTPPANVDNGDNPTVPGQPAPGDNADGQNQDQGQAAGQGSGQGGGTPDQPDQDIAPIPPNTWLPAHTARIGVLDKIDGSVSEMSIPVGGQSVIGDLQVNVQACMIRPPDQVPDAAVFLSLQGIADLSAPPNYRGWLVRSAPGAAVAGDASETFRVIACD